MSDIDAVERVYEAYAAQDLDGLLALCDPACAITQDPATLAVIAGIDDDGQSGVLA